jgi:hypothetical protein
MDAPPGSMNIKRRRRENRRSALTRVRVAGIAELGLSLAELFDLDFFGGYANYLTVSPDYDRLA